LISTLSGSRSRNPTLLGANSACRHSCSWPHGYGHHCPRQCSRRRTPILPFVIPIDHRDRRAEPHAIISGSCILWTVRRIVKKVNLPSLSVFATMGRPRSGTGTIVTLIAPAPAFADGGESTIELSTASADAPKLELSCQPSHRHGGGSGCRSEQTGRLPEGIIAHGRSRRTSHRTASGGSPDQPAH
jgi:hypothetical protein